MHVEFLVEESSAEAALSELLPKIIGPDATWKIHAHQGKKDLLKKLPDRLRGYAKWLPQECIVLVLIDRDRDDCHVLKQCLNQTASLSGLSTSRSTGVQVINRIAVEELESWFLGDIEALRAAFPRIPATLDHKAAYRDPDAIQGGTWEALQRVLRRAGYIDEGLAKIAAARTISKHMDPSRNQSKSFQVFRDALRQALATH